MCLEQISSYFCINLLRPEQVEIERNFISVKKGRMKDLLDEMVSGIDGSDKSQQNQPQPGRVMEGNDGNRYGVTVNKSSDIGLGLVFGRMINKQCNVTLRCLEARISHTSSRSNAYLRARYADFVCKQLDNRYVQRLNGRVFAF